MFDHRFDQFGIRRFVAQIEFFELSFLFPNYVDRPQSCFFDQARELFLSERIDIVVYLFEINAVFTKQLGQIPASRSGRFFVNCDFRHFMRGPFPEYRRSHEQ